MTVIILSVLLVMGVPLWADQLIMKSYQDYIGIPNESASAVWTDQLPVKSEGDLTSEVFDKDGASCYYPFEPVGNNCYFFSDEQRNYHGAMSYCDSLSHAQGHASEVVTLAMLGFDKIEDQALLDAAVSKDKSFWIGGNTEDGVNWKWQDNRDINLQAPFWNYDEPNEAQNKCMIAQPTAYNNIIRSYLYDYNCEESMNFICQTGCPFDFRRIDNHCYFISEELGVARASWSDARDYCQSLAVPVGHHADLAVLGLPDQDDYLLINSLAVGYTYSSTWLGAFEESDCDFKWIDGRVFPLSSTYWKSDEPSCGRHHVVLLYHNTYLNRTFLIDLPVDYPYPFICQMFKD